MRQIRNILLPTLFFCVLLLIYKGSNGMNDPSEPLPITGKIHQETIPNPFMPKMTNETLKAELGNAGWKLFHSVLARYPVEPKQEEKESVANYIHYFAQVYPCGDCARHFAVILKENPPQLSSRETAAVWGCHIHNKVNKRLGKPNYDCSHILEDYDCGCGEPLDLVVEEKQQG